MTMLNQLRTGILLALLTGILLWIGNYFGGPSGLLIALILSLAMNFGMYWFSHKLVLAMYRAKPLNKSQYPWLHQMVRELADEAKLPMPALYHVPSETPNAFATGRNPEHAVVAVTDGILHLLTREELRGVLAHELSHVKNRDMLVTTIAATIAGVISYAASMARWAAIFGGIGGRDNEGGGNMLSFIVLAIVAPLIAVILQLAISRSREYLADASGAKLIKNGAPLSAALQKLESSNKAYPMRFGSPATSSLFIVNPFRGAALAGLFSTHPSTSSRVERLKGMRF